LATCSNPIEKSDDFLKLKKSVILASRKPKKKHIVFSHFEEKKTISQLAKFSQNKETLTEEQNAYIL